MEGFDLLSFKLELADLLEKYDIKIAVYYTTAEIYFYNTTNNLEFNIGDELTPKELRK
jgi:hypothetical protein